MRFVFGVFGCLLAFQLPTSASAQSVGDWSVSAAQGYEEHIVGLGPGNSFNITCDIGASGENEPKQTRVYVEIAGKSPKPHSYVDIFAVDAVYRLPVDDKGYINTECRVCEANLAGLWSKLRKSTAIVVQYQDGSNVSLKTRGAAKALPAKPCTTGPAR
ncbi:hypothetical protein [Methylorubrum extorquens]|uniref:hypothetical protein n=1 Tax=Methylorubrum extorquens TaxID=408 RepID=UPI0011813187|nr:hypothetical protein [Methylorubrum extorquens]